MSGVTTSTPLDALIARRIDFPTWMPATLVKELRQGLHARGFVATLVGFQIVMTLILVFAIAGGTGSGTFNMLQGAFWVVLNVQLLIITPVRALVGLQAELDSRWIDLVVLTRLTAWRVVLGKWISLLVQAALLVAAMLPYGVARYFFGSVDLVGEARMVAITFAGSATLTAAALWCSSLSKLARLALGAVLLLAWQIVPGWLQALFSMGSRSAPPPSAPWLLTGANGWLAGFDALVVVAICLTGAARRLAPRAESQTALMRLLPLLPALPAPLIGARDMAGQIAVASALFGFVAALELARAEEPLDVHWRAWAQRGAWGRAIGRFVQPGWASAAEWIIAVAAVLIGLAAVGLVDPVRIALPALLGVEALLFPAVMLTWMTSHFSHRSSGYALVLGGASVIALVATGLGSMVRGNLAADSLLMVLPISSFWMTLTQGAPPTMPVFAGQLTIAAGVLALAWWRTGPWRRQRREFKEAAEMP